MKKNEMAAVHNVQRVLVFIDSSPREVIRGAHKAGLIHFSRRARNHFFMMPFSPSLHAPNTCAKKVLEEVLKWIENAMKLGNENSLFVVSTAKHEDFAWCLEPYKVPLHLQFIPTVIKQIENAFSEEFHRNELITSKLFALGDFFAQFWMFSNNGDCGPDELFMTFGKIHAHRLENTLTVNREHFESILEECPKLKKATENAYGKVLSSFPLRGTASLRGSTRNELRRCRLNIVVFSPLMSTS